MRLRRAALFATVLGLAVPLGGRAQTEEDAQRTRIELEGHGGRGFYLGTCGGANQVRYGGGSASFSQTDGRLSGRMVAGASGGTVEAFGEDPGGDAPTAPEGAGWLSGGILFQPGGEWEAFGFALGLGVVGHADAALPLFPLTLRLGPAVRDANLTILTIRLGAMDDPTLTKSGLAWMEVAWIESEEITLRTGVSGLLFPDSSALVANLYVECEFGLGEGFFVGARSGWTPSSRLPDGYQLGALVGWSRAP